MLDCPLLKTLVFSGILLVLVVLTHGVIFPLQLMLFGDWVQHAGLVYLPLGYWVIVSYYERWWAAVYLSPGLVVALLLYGNPDLSLPGQVATLVVLATSAPLVFAVVSWASDRENEPMSEPVAWRLIVAVGVISALVTSLGLHMIRHVVLPGAASPRGIVTYATSGTLGVFMCFVVLSAAFRIRRRVPRTG